MFASTNKLQKLPRFFIASLYLTKMNNLLLVALMVLALTTSFAQKKSIVKKQPIIDMHLHALWWGTGEMIGALGLKAPKDVTAMRDSTFYYLKKYNIVKAVTDDAFALDYFHLDPQRIIPARQGINPFLAPDPIDSLRKWFKAGTYKILAEFMPQYVGYRVDDLQVDPYFKVAEEFDIPVGVHLGIGKTGFPKYTIANGNPIYLENVLIKHPKLRVYVMHAGYPFMSEMIAILTTYPNVYVDIAVINWVLPKKEFHFYLQRLVEAGFGDRIMYGSDEMMWPQSIKISIENVRSASFLTTLQMEDIFYNNAARFLRLSEEEIKRHQ
jgi:predicted TIM-barrel fold metal-dependent hydrolase